MKKFVIKTNGGYLKSFFRNNEVKCTDNIETAKLYNSSHKCSVVMAHNKELFKQLTPTIIEIELNIIGVNIVESRFLEQYQS